MLLTLCHVTSWPPSVRPTRFDDGLYAAATSQPLDKLRINLAHFCIGIFVDPDHRARLIETRVRFVATMGTKIEPEEIVT